MKHAVNQTGTSEFATDPTQQDTLMLSLTKKPTEQEIKFLEQITRPGVQIELAIPLSAGEDPVNVKDWYTSTAIVCRAYLRAEQQQQALMPCLGRLLQIAKETPAIWEGSDSFADFMREVVPAKFGVSRSTAYEAMEVAIRFPNLTVGEFKQIGRQNMRVAARAIPRGEEHKKWAQTLLAKAAELSLPKLREHCQSKGYLDVGEDQGAFFKFSCNQAQLKILNGFIQNPAIQAFCATADPARILIAAIQEAETEWLAQAHDAQANHAQQQSYTNGHTEDWPPEIPEEPAPPAEIEIP